MFRALASLEEPGIKAPTQPVILTRNLSLSHSYRTRVARGAHSRPSHDTGTVTHAVTLISHFYLIRVVDDGNR